MDEKTVIARPKLLSKIEPKPSLEEKIVPVQVEEFADAKPEQGVAEKNVPEAEADKTIVVRPAAADKKPQNESVKATSKIEKPVKVKPQKPASKDTPKVASSAKPPQGNGAIFALFAVALLFVGFGAALVTIYLAASPVAKNIEVANADLSNDIVAISTPESEAEDEALVRAAIQPRIIELSGDPVILRQLSNAPRKFEKLDKDAQRQAASSLGYKSDVFRLKDELDVPNIGLQSGAMGNQEDIASVDSNADQFVTADSTVIAAGGDAPTNHVSEFVQHIQSKQPLSNFLTSLGLEAEHAKKAEDTFTRLHGRQALQKGDQVAVRAVASETDPNQLIPMQVSVYSGDGYIGSVAINDIDIYADAADPWYGVDIFETQLLPDQANPDDQPRLLDAIYASALRNRLPTPVIGEAIILLSRTQDLEQKVETGDTLTILYSPLAKDPKTGFGRIIFVSIGRASGNLDCYVVQAQLGARFDCAVASEASTVEQAGMTMPVSGTIIAKFGAQTLGKDAASSTANADPGKKPVGTDVAKANTNFGVDWSAPKGAPVVAAFAGDVTAVGKEDKYGLVVRISHADGKASMYGYLDRAQQGIVVGTKVVAGQTVGFVGNPASSRDPRLHFELLDNGVPVDPMAVVDAPQPSGPVGAVESFVGRIIHIESANRCDARNPLSTAVGLGQFIESTWITTVKIHRPDLFGKFSRGQLLDMRTNCQLARSMTSAFTRDNAAVIRQAGHNVTPGNLYLAHFLGVGGAIKVLSNNPNRQIADVFGASHVRANPFESGKSIGYLVSWAAKKMTGSPPPPGADHSGKAKSTPAPSVTATKAAADGSNKSNPPDTPAALGAVAIGANQTPQVVLTQYATDPVFMQLKATVNSLLR